MSKSRKRIYIPDIYVGFLILPVIVIIGLIAGVLLNPIMELLNFFKK
jgi:hypothetical protein